MFGVLIRDVEEILHFYMSYWTGVFNSRRQILDSHGLVSIAMIPYSFQPDTFM